MAPWVLIAVGALGMVLTQYAFSLAPLSASLPVIASLDPLFSVAIGVSVYGERLRGGLPALLAEFGCLAALISCVALITRRST